MERLLGGLVLSKLEMSSEIILADSLIPLFIKNLQAVLLKMA